MKSTLLAAGALIFLTVPASPGTSAEELQPTEVNLRAADAEDLRIALTDDVKAARTFMHPNLLVNSPANRIFTKTQVINMLQKGEIAHHSLERTIESTALTGNIGVVMGQELVQDKTPTEAGQSAGSVTYTRRFTDIFLFENGTWRLLARQSTVVKPTR